ncbi:MAG TPA: hypothetical protein VGK73_01375 [Polyangiaceae bacterium]
MQANRLSVKIYAAETRPAELFIPVFHRFIREQVFGELAIDVADYGHVPEGPGVALIGHAFDYYWDDGEGRPGLVYTRKREPKPAAERLGHAVQQLLVGARLLEADPTLSGLRFRTGELLVRALDRLNAPPTEAGFAELRSEVGALGQKLFGASNVERVGDAREPLSARLTASNAPASVAELASRLG